MIKRDLSTHIKRAAKEIPIIVVNGPRQSGKTTLVREVFSDYEYVNLERPDLRDFATNDPLGFLNRYNEHAIFDEIQNVPELFSYIQVASDEKKKNGLYILTGSQNFLLSEKISQTLAGRTLNFVLLPFSMNEIKKSLDKFNPDLNKIIYKGFYPRLYDSKLNPFDWYMTYTQTYLERDVRQIINIENAGIFNNFLKLIAGRNGQVLQFSNIANEIGVSHNTIRNWVSVLEQSYIIFLLRPYYKNFKKRIIKSPKVFFYDTGLVCSLLGIRNADDVDLHFAKGGLFESLVIADMLKENYNNNLGIDLYYWRDSNMNEVDCVYKKNSQEFGLEIKSSTTFHSSFSKGLNYINSVSNNKFNPAIIYGGDENFTRDGIKVYPYYDVKKFFN